MATKERSDAEKLQLAHLIIGGIIGVLALALIIFVSIVTQPTEEETRKRLADRYNNELTACNLSTGGVSGKNGSFRFCSLSYIEDKNGHAIGVNIYRTETDFSKENTHNELYFTTRK